MAALKIVIRKYGNRRLYDTASSRYVNLDDIARLIRAGAEVQVVDARSGQDLTRVILTQIIVEEARAQQQGLPVEVLRQLVVASDRVLAEAKQALAGPFEYVRQLLAGAPPDASEVQQLRRRVEQLEARLAERKRRARTPKKAAKRTI